MSGAHTCLYPNSSAMAVGCHDHDVDRGKARLIVATTRAQATDATANTTFGRRRCNLRSASIAWGPAKPEAYRYAFHLAIRSPLATATPLERAAFNASCG